MDLALLAARAHGAADLVAVADIQSGRQVAKDSVRVSNFVLLEAQPQGRHVVGPCLLRRGDQDLHTDGREPVVREVHLLNRWALPAELGQALCTTVVDLVLVELQHPELWATLADLEDQVEPAGGELVL